MNLNHAKVLIANLRHIGDVILTTPLIALLKEAFPDVIIDMLVNRGTGEFLEKDPRVRKVVYSDKLEYKQRGPSSGYLVNLFRKYDLAISINSSDRGAIAILVGSRKFRVGYYDPDRSVASLWRRLLYSHPLRIQPELHTVMRCHEIATKLKLPPSDHLTVKIYYDKSDSALVSATLNSSGPVGSYFVIHPFARWGNKFWDIRNFTELSDQIANKFNLTPVWTSSPDPEETKVLATAANNCSVTPIAIPGIFSLCQIASLLQGAKLYVGLDTAISHLAASIGVPMVALYGPTKMWCWHPWDNHALISDYESATISRGTFRNGSTIALQSACEHSPACLYPHCSQNNFPRNPCMMALSTQDVFEEVIELLS